MTADANGVEARYRNDRIFRFAIDQAAQRAVCEAIAAVPQKDQWTILPNSRRLALESARQAILNWVGIAGDTRS